MGGEGSTFFGKSFAGIGKEKVGLFAHCNGYGDLPLIPIAGRPAGCSAAMTKTHVTPARLIGPNPLL